jgi:hypothetical protein
MEPPTSPSELMEAVKKQEIITERNRAKRLLPMSLSCFIFINRRIKNDRIKPVEKTLPL